MVSTPSSSKYRRDIWPAGFPVRYVRYMHSHVDGTNKQVLSRWRCDWTLRTHTSVSATGEGHASWISALLLRQKANSDDKVCPCGGTVVKQFGERRHFPADLPLKQTAAAGALQPVVSAVCCRAAVSHLAVLAVFFLSSFHGEMLMFVPSCASKARGFVETICNSNAITPPPLSVT